MNMTDPIADILTRIRNAVSARHANVLIPNSRMKEQLVKVLENEGYIDEYAIKEVDNHTYIDITLRYNNKSCALTHLQRVSKPGLRVYSKRTLLPHVRGGLGIAVISTSKGLMTGRSAYQQGLGGEVLCYIW